MILYHKILIIMNLDKTPMPNTRLSSKLLLNVINNIKTKDNPIHYLPYEPQERGKISKIGNHCN